MRIILLGPPGSGKGTQAYNLAKFFKIPSIISGDILRETVNSGSKIGNIIKKYIDNGLYVPDEFIIHIIDTRLKSNDCCNGYLLDGFPRTVSQAQYLQKVNINFDYVIEIFIPDHEIISRIIGRRIHTSSGRIYHLIYNPPKISGCDDITGEPLVQRDDDQEEIVKHRLRIYHEKTDSLINYYRNMWLNEKSINYVKIYGLDSIETVQNKIITAITKNNRSIVN